MSRPKDYEELYNLRHAAARNVVERIFGVLKERYAIMNQGCDYPINTQVQVVLAMCALFNCIRHFEASDFEIELAGAFPSAAALESWSSGEAVPHRLDGGFDGINEEDRPSRRNYENIAEERLYHQTVTAKIAISMWDDYQALYGASA